MKPFSRLLRTCLLVLLAGSTALPSSAITYRFREQYWQLYHRQLYERPLDIAENIHWLEQALRADFANPLYALSRIENDRQWEKYRALFTMHLNLKLVEQYLLWGAEHMKFDAYFFNYPWRRQNLESLEKAETLFNYALVYWQEAKKYSDAATGFPWLYLTDVQFWEDEHFRIQTGQLDYQTIIAGHLDRLERVRGDFLAMDESTY